MRKSTIAAKIRAKAPVKLAFMGHDLPRFIAYAAHTGYDGIWLDLEHRPLERHAISHLLSLSHLYNIDVLVRPATRERAQLYRYLEDGAAGFIMPHVSDLESARDIVRAVKFPPIGDRGIEGNSLESNFGLDLVGKTRSDLAQHANSETLLCLQIETTSGLEHAADIAKLKGVDMLYVGPADMSLRLENSPEAVRPSMDDIYRRISSICEAVGKPWGAMPRSLDDLQHFKALGATLHVWGRDHLLLLEGLKMHSKALDDLLG